MSNSDALTPTPITPAKQATLARLFERIRGVHAEVKDIDMQLAGVEMIPRKHQMMRMKGLLDLRAAKEYEFKTLHRQYKYESAGKLRKAYLAIINRLFPLNP